MTLEREGGGLAREVRGAIADPRTLVRAVLRDHERRATLRPVLVGGKQLVQIETVEDGRARACNVAPATLVKELDALLEAPWRSAHIRTTTEEIELRTTRRGRVLVSRKRKDSSADLEHDRPKRRLVEPVRSGAFLRAVGISTADGRVRAGRQAKYRQIDEFARIVDAATRELAAPVRIVDLGCGNAYLTFSLYHLLAEIRGLECSVTGVDRSAEAIERNNAIAAELGWRRVEFVRGEIAEFDADAAPGIVVALHACDTATDDAITRAIRWRSGHFFGSPCCHHHLQRQLRAGSPAQRILLRNPILAERLGDVLTDALRAHIMRLLGWSAEVIQFVETEHTDRNLLIRATRTGAAPREADVRAYLDLIGEWRVRPHLAELLSDELEAVTKLG